MKEAQPPRLLAHLPLALAATASVMLLPVALAALIVPRGGAMSMATSAIAAIALSIAIAGVESSLWKRLSRARDVTFSELMLWGLLRRAWAERGLAERRELYRSAQRIGPTVSIDQLERLSRMLEARDSYTYGHSRRVARHAARIATAMKLPAEEVAKVRTAAAVHDVGKIYTPREILNNPNRLTDAEFDVVKRHAADGGEMLATVGDPDIAAMVRHHHERIDGSGYPDGLSGEQIPLGARIIAVADTFDALTSNRAYRGANTHRRALRIIAAESGAQLDGDVAAAFASRYSSRRATALLALAAIAPERIFAGLQSAATGVGSGLGGVPGGFGSLIPALGASGLLALSPAALQLAGEGGGAHGRPAVAQAGARSASAPALGPYASGGLSFSPYDSARRPHRTRAEGPGRTRRRRGGEGFSEGQLPQTQAGTPVSLTSSASAAGQGAGAPAPMASSPAGGSSVHSTENGGPGSQQAGASSEGPSSGGPSRTPAPASGSSQAEGGLQEALSGTAKTVAGATNTVLSGTVKAATSTTKAVLSGTTKAATSTTKAILSGTMGALGAAAPALPSGKEATEASAPISSARGTIEGAVGALLPGLGQTLSRTR